MGTKNWALKGAAFHSIAFGPGDVPFIAYQDGQSAKLAAVRKWSNADQFSTDGQWLPVGTTGYASDGRADYVSLAVTVSGTPFVAFRDSVNGNKATVRRLAADGATWQTVGSAGFSDDRVIDTSMLLAAGDVPYVAFVEEVTDTSSGTPVTTNQGSVYKYVDGTGWTNVGPKRFTGACSYLRLQLDTAGNPWVAYADASGKATVQQYDPQTGAYVPVRKGITVDEDGNEITPPGPSFDRADLLSFALDTTSSPPKPYIAFRDAASSGNTAVRWFVQDEPDGWVGDPLPDSASSSISLRINTLGFPVLAYATAGCNKELPDVMITVKEFDAFWNPVGQACFSDAAGESGLALGLYQSGNAVVFASDEAAGQGNDEPGVVWRILYKE